MIRVMLGLVAAAGAPLAALAHPGPRVWVGIENNTIRTYAGPYPPSNPANYQPSRVFTASLVDEGDDIWFTEFPGYQIVPGGTIPGGTTFSYNITGPLLWYNEGGPLRCPYFEPVQQHFASSPPVPQCAVTNELFQTRITSSGFVGGHLTFGYNGSTGDHNHLTYTLLGDGSNAGGGPDGVYALPLQLTANGFSASETFYLVLGKNALAGELATAAEIILAPRVRPDLDCDGDVDGADLEMLAVCRTRAGMALPTPEPGQEHCDRADFDADLDVDLDDFAVYQRCYSGSAPAEPGCG